MTNNSLQRLQMIKVALYELTCILERENERNWIRAINNMQERADIALSGNSDYDEAIDYISDTYKKINAGNGSFSDFNVCREVFEDCRQTNQKLDSIKGKIFDLLG